MLRIGALACVYVGINVVICVVVTGTCCVCFLAYGALAAQVYVCLVMVLHCTYVWWVQPRVTAHVGMFRW